MSTGHVRLEVRCTSATPAAEVHGSAILLPRAFGPQRVHAMALTADPEPATTDGHLDVHGNTVTYLHVTTPHERLDVTARALLTVARRTDPATLPPVPWEQAAAHVAEMRATGRTPHGEGARSMTSIVDHALPSQLATPDEGVLTYAVESFPPGLPLVQVAHDLALRISTDITEPVAPGAEDPPGTTPAPDAVARHALPAPAPDVVRDLRGSSGERAHLMVAALRAVGQSARHVVGHVTGEPAGTRAWVAVWVPGGGWLHVDPTAGVLADSRHVVLGWGRDHSDVAPVLALPDAVVRPALDVTSRALTKAELDGLLVGAEEGGPW